MMNTSNEDILEPEIQEYLDFLNETTQSTPNVVQKSRIKKNLNKFGEAINTFLVYPDLLADIMTPKDSEFSMFFAQRMLLRAMSRSRQSFHTFTRGFSKSFTAFYSRYVTTMLLPGHKSFVTAGTKGQAASIAQEKIVDDLWRRFPLFQNEMQKQRIAGQLRNAFVRGADYAEFRFSHGGIFDVVGGTIRGYRRNSGIFEEVIELDETFTNEVAIPLLNIARVTKKGKTNPKEPHASKIFVTTAGYQGTYAYRKQLETLCLAAIDPSQYMVLMGSYKIPVMHGLLQETTIKELISSTTYDKDSFEREYMSIWSGAQVGAVFSANTIVNLRKVIRAEQSAVAPRDESNPHFYIVSADMAKDGSANTSVVIIKVQPSKFFFRYSVVNLFTIKSTDYEIVSNILKKTVLKYDAELLVYDAMGIGASIRDWLNKASITKDDEALPGLGIINPPATAEPDLIKYNKATGVNICYEIKATGSSGQQIHQFFFSRISNGAIRFLIRSSEAVTKFSELKSFKTASYAKKESKLRPYLFMDQMEVELKNLQLEDTSDNINRAMKITRRDPKIQKDFFSATEYGVYAVNILKELEYYKRKNKRPKNASDFVIIN